jgi:hypothetical protein
MTETVAISCQDCYSRTQGFPCIYNVTCSDCRLALALAEPCKIIRKSMVESMEKKFGEVGDWKQEPHCGCGQQCSRLKNMRETQ